jgi:hypothetical protein
MTAFLLSGTLGFIIYQCLAWANVPRGRPSFDIGHIKIRFTSSAAVWARRTLRLVIAILILGVIMLLNRPLLASDAVSKSEVAILLGAFWGPLFGIWINAVIANSAGANLTRGQFVAGIGLALVFLIGSVGNETGSLLREYARKLSNLKIAGAELSFSDRSKAGSPGSGAVPSPGKELVSGSAGLTYLAGLDDMIGRDEKYLDLFRRIELKEMNDELRRLQQAVGGSRPQQLSETGASSDARWEGLRNRLDTAKAFAQAITKPLNCLVGWYEVTGDAVSINRHLASYGDLFRRVQAIDSKQQIDDIANGFVRVLITMAMDVVASVPSPLIGDRCNKLLEQFCPTEVSSQNRQPLRWCLDNSLKAVAETSRTSVSRVENIRDSVAQGLKRFVDTDGIEGRPYFVIGYASILTQLGQHTAAGAVLDGWLQRRKGRAPDKARWALAEEWFDMRARSMLAAYMEEWIRTYGSQPPTNVLDEHIENMDHVHKYLEGRLSQTLFFQNAYLAMERRTEKQAKIDDIGLDPGRCNPKDGDFDQWSLLFDSYVTLRLTRIQTMLLHFHYPEKFAKSTVEEVRKLANLDLSCISDPVAAKTYAAQILESFSRNAMIYTELRGKLDSDDTIKARLSEAIDAAVLGEKLLADAKKLEDAKKLAEAKTPEEVGKNQSFLRRVETGEIASTQEKLRANLRWLRRAQLDV